MSRKYKRHSEKEITRHLKDQTDGGLSVTAYCKKHKLVYQTFLNWKKTKNLRLPKFIQVEIPVTHQTSIEIKLPNGIQAKLESADQISLIEKLMQVKYA